MVRPLSRPARLLAPLAVAALLAQPLAAPPATAPGAAGPAVPVAPPGPEILVEADFRAAEAALAVAGYGPGPVDGRWGEADAAALAAYQADWGLPETGRLAAGLVARLLREHPATRSQWVETADGCRVWNRYPQPRETVSWTADCVGGLTSGRGVLTWTSVLRGAERVETYEGGRVGGREHGEGVYLGADGSRYEGGYRDGLRHGYGVYDRADGSSYEGAWEKGVQHGFGVAVWRDGSRYEGQLADGRPDGEGTLTFADGNVYSGTWRAGCFAEAFRGAVAGVPVDECGFGPILQVR